MLEVKKSKIEHFESGSGVFVELANKKSKLPIGQLLGFVPGIMFETMRDFEIFYKNKTKVFDEKLERYNGAVLDMNCKIPYPYSYGSSIEEYYSELEQRT